MKKKKFYNFARDPDSGERELYIEGEIADSVWFGDECTPGQFRSELFGGKGAITLWINSNGGDCVAASQIYTMLMDYQGDVTVKIFGMAASAASVIAMAGTKVLMSPTALKLIHNPWTVAVGDKSEMAKAGVMLDEVKESIINAYEIKTGLSRTKISHLMDDETPMSVHKAIALGFCDGILEPSKSAPPAEDEPPQEPEPQPQEQPKGKTVESLYERLNLISNKIGGINHV
jgi:ATP-dependent Clp protease protease subunit